MVGLSGGLDSTLALLITARAMDMLGRPRTDITAVTMPCFGTTSRTKSNAQVLAESCLRQGAPVFDDGAAVLAQLTAGEMEALLRRLSGEAPSPAPAAVHRHL